MMSRTERTRLALVLVILALLHFALRPRLGSARVAPDFLMLALLIYAMRGRPGGAAVAGFLIGIVGDALAPVRFGAGALAHTLVGYLAAWGRAVFFADNLLVNAAVFAAGTWLRNLIQLLASGTTGEQLMSQLLVWSTIQALTTSVAGVIVLLIFRNWLDIRLEE